MNTLFTQIRQHIQNSSNPLIVVLGPTASGKTALAVKIAQQFGGEIISTDSRQIYQEMSISTDAVSEEEQQGVPHHLLQFARPDQIITLAEYSDLARQKILEIQQKNKLPILAGGTGLYISAIIENYDMPRIAPDFKLRAELEKVAAKKGSQYLYDELNELDPAKAATIHPHNLRYVIRALEVLRAKPVKKNHQKIDCQPFLVGVDWPRAELYKRIDARVERQLQRGLLQEVQKLVDKGYDHNLPAMTGLGIKEIMPYLEGKVPLEECVEILKRDTRHYAKRQMTWFRRYDNVHWLTPEQLQAITSS